ncbi:hypothetical protein Bca52824_080383 [Brassica carinata]|uniref:Uncharacterized protein n=1 Tax=Brassica carinata TaxID=52824 RepID=A0A8X7TQ67_BRACI|nr:hypothetical protein Bca52824_080383 [Brassica carinata]
MKRNQSSEIHAYERPLSLSLLSLETGTALAIVEGFLFLRVCFLFTSIESLRVCYYFELIEVSKSDRIVELDYFVFFGSDLKRNDFLGGSILISADTDPEERKPKLPS